MCHLARFAQNRVTKSPVMLKFTKDVIKVVDKFHMRGHVGDWCRANVNAKRWPQLDNANTSVSEQQFRLRARFAPLVRGMNEQHFNLTCFMICKSRQDWHLNNRSHV